LGTPEPAKESPEPPAMTTKFVTLSVRDEEYREITRTMRTTDKLNTLIDFY
jgi:hypothetical protein